MFCPNCGKQNLENSDFCFSCGFRLKQSDAVQESVQSTQQIQQPIQQFQQQQFTQQSIQQSIQQPVQEPDQSTQQIQQQSVQQTIQQPKQKSSKKIFLLIIAIIVIVLLVFVIKHFFVDGNIGNIGGNVGNNESKISKNLYKIYDANSFIPIKKDDKYGYINTDGKVVIEPQYKKTFRFYGDYAKVWRNNDNGKTIVSIIDKNGNIKLTQGLQGKIEYIEDYDIWFANYHLYDGTLKNLSSDELKVIYGEYGYLEWYNLQEGLVGIMDTTGKITYTYKFEDNVSPFISINTSDVDDVLKERYCCIVISNFEAIVNCDTGKVINDYTDNFVLLEDNNVFEIKNIKTKEFISRIYIQNDKIIYQTTDEDVDLKYYNGYVLIKDEKKGNSYIDVKTGKITDKKPSSLGDIDISSLDRWEKVTDYIKFSCDSGYGLKKDGNIKLSCEWSDIKYFDLNLYKYLSSEGKEYVLAEKDDKVYLINLKDGKTVAEFNISDCNLINSVDDSTFIYYEENETGKYFVYNLITGKSLTVEGNSDIDLYSNYVTIEENNKLNYYNMDLKLIYTEE